MLDDALDLWSWALLPARLVRLAEEEHFLLSKVLRRHSLRHRAVLAWGLCLLFVSSVFVPTASLRPLQPFVGGRRIRACAEEARILCLGRDLINTPANVLGSRRLASKRCVPSAEDKRWQTFARFVGEALLEENYPLIHVVGRSAREEPRLLEVRWEASLKDSLANSLGSLQAPTE